VLGESGAGWREVEGVVWGSSVDVGEDVGERWDALYHMLNYGPFFVWGFETLEGVVLYPSSRAREVEEGVQAVVLQWLVAGL